MLLLTCICTLAFAADARNGNLFQPFSNKRISNLSAEKLDVPVHAPLLIGSFNIQTLGSKKFKNPDVIYTVEKIIHRYDLILLMELMTADQRFMRDFLRDVNLFAPDGVVYNMTLSERHPNTSEHSAILYRTNKLRLMKDESYNDPANFYRKPLIAIFEAYTLRDMVKFGVIGHHVKPSQAVKEIDALAEVYDYGERKYGIKNFLLMGDFNADCTYVKESDWDEIALWNRPEFTWPISSHTDTTTNYKSCALDRFVYAGENMNDGVILPSARIFNYQKEFDLTTEETRSISDHWPIEIKIRGKLSDVAEKHLSTDICFRIRDSQPKSIPQKDALQSPKPSDFNVTETVHGIVLTNKTRDARGLLLALNRLRSSLPSVVTHELERAVEYKIEHGSLEDESSFAEIWEPCYVISVYVTEQYVEASICKTTTVN